MLTPAQATRRALFAGALASATLALPATAVATAAAADDARFLEWERRYRAATDYANSGTYDDDELDRRIDIAGEWESLIYRTPGAGLNGARVKASVLLENMQEFVIGREDDRAALRSIVDTLRRLT